MILIPVETAGTVLMTSTGSIVSAHPDLPGDSAKEVRLSLHNVKLNRDVETSQNRNLTLQN